MPSAVFSQPPIGQVGLTEEQVTCIWHISNLKDCPSVLDFHGYTQAIQKYGDVDIFTANFRPLKATLSGLPDRVFMKLIVCATTNKVLGLHMCGDDSPEIVQVSVFGDIMPPFFSRFSYLYYFGYSCGCIMYYTPRDLRLP